MMHRERSVEISFAEIVVQKRNHRSGFGIGREVVRGIAHHPTKGAQHIRGKHVLIRGNAHCLGVVAVLALSRVFLHLLVRNLEAREAVPDNQSKTIHWSEIALVVDREISSRPVVRKVFGNNRVQVPARAVTRRACAQRISTPNVLSLSEGARCVEAAS